VECLYLQFTVYGKPVTQGSTRSVPMRAKGGGYQTDAKGRPKLMQKHDEETRLIHWRQQIAQSARRQYQGPLSEEAIFLALVFHRPRPKGHFGTGRNANILKASAPEYPTQQPDTIKLTRAVEDALTGVVWRNDSQVVRHELLKVWGDCFRLDVTITSQMILAAEVAEKGGES